MYDQTELDRLVDAMRATGVTKLKCETRRKTLRLVLPHAAPEQTQPAVADAPRREVAKSPGIGTFLPRGLDDGLARLEPSAGVSAGEVLGYLQQGPALLPILAPVTGKRTGDAPEPGGLLGYGDIVFTVDIQT